MDEWTYEVQLGGGRGLPLTFAKPLKFKVQQLEQVLVLVQQSLISGHFNWKRCYLIDMLV